VNVSTAIVDSQGIVCGRGTLNNNLRYVFESPLNLHNASIIIDLHGLLADGSDNAQTHIVVFQVVVEY